MATRRVPPTPPERPKQTTKADYPFAIEWVDLSICFADQETYQRELKPQWIAAKSKPANFKPGRIGTLVGSRREDGRIALVDGQQRAAVLRKLGWTHAWIIVYSGLTIEQEAAEFVSYNFDRNNVQSWDQYRGMRAAGDPDVVGADGICRALGFEVIGKSRLDSALGCCKTIIDIYLADPDVFREVSDEKRNRQLKGPANLREVLSFLDINWRRSVSEDQWKSARTASMLRGLSRFFFVNVDVTAEDLSRATSDALPKMIIANSRATGGGHGRGVDSVIQEIWNRYVDGQKAAVRKASKPKKPRRPTSTVSVAAATATVAA